MENLWREHSPPPYSPPPPEGTVKLPQKIDDLRSFLQTRRKLLEKKLKKSGDDERLRKDLLLTITYLDMLNDADYSRVFRGRTLQCVIDIFVKMEARNPLLPLPKSLFMATAPGPRGRPRGGLNYGRGKFGGRGNQIQVHSIAQLGTYYERRRGRNGSIITAKYPERGSHHQNQRSTHEDHSKRSICRPPITAPAHQDPIPSFPHVQTNGQRVPAPHLNNSPAPLPSPQMSPPHIPSPHIPSPQIPSPQIPSSHIPLPQIPSSHIPLPHIPSPQIPPSHIPPPNIPSPQIPPPHMPHPQIPPLCIPPSQMPPPQIPPSRIPPPHMLHPPRPPLHMQPPHIPPYMPPLHMPPPHRPPPHMLSSHMPPPHLPPQHIPPDMPPPHIPLSHMPPALDPANANSDVFQEMQDWLGSPFSLEGWDTDSDSMYFPPSTPSSFELECPTFQNYYL